MTVRMNELLISTTWKNLRNTTLSEKHLISNGLYYIIPFILSSKTGTCKSKMLNLRKVLIFGMGSHQIGTQGGIVEY